MKMSKERYKTLCNEEDSIPLFSQYWWLEAVCGEDFRDVLLVEKNGKVLAALPLYEPLQGVVSMPHYTQSMGVWYAPFSDDTKYHSALEQRQSLCKQLIDRLKIRSFMQNFDYSFTDWLPFYWQGFQQTTRYTYLLKNIKDSDLLWSDMSVQTRRNIRKAEEDSNIVVKTGVSADDFIKIQKQTFERQGIKNKQDENVLRRLIDVSRSRGQGEIFGGYDTNEVLHAAVFVVWQRSSAYYIAGGSNPSLRDSGAHSLTIWKSIKYVSNFTDVFDFEGSMLPGVERFFRDFGAVQTPYFTISKGKMTLLNRVLIKIKRLCLQKH